HALCDLMRLRSGVLRLTVPLDRTIEEQLGATLRVHAHRLGSPAIPLLEDATAVRPCLVAVAQHRDAALLSGRLHGSDQNQLRRRHLIADPEDGLGVADLFLVGLNALALQVDGALTESRLAAALVVAGLALLL